MKIAAICATPRGRNTGMRCVDRALELLLAQTPWKDAVDYYCFDVPKDLAVDAAPYLPLTAFPGHDHYRAVILWGDFILAKGWIELMIGHIVRREGWAEDKARAHVYDVLLPPSAEHAAKMVAFGQSLQLGDDGLFGDNFYLPRLKQLLTSAPLARLRDPISAHRAGMIAGLPPAQFSGIDAALMLNLLDPPPPGRDPAGNTQVGVFLGRTESAQLAQFGVARALRRAGLRASWIPWLPGKEMSGYMKTVFGIRDALIEKGDPTVADFLAAVRRCRLIVTDAYHLTLMAWSSGVPAICLGKGTQPFTKTTHDKKKEIFFASHYLSRFYLFSDDALGDLRSGRYRDCVELALTSNAAQEVQARIATMAAENMDALMAALTELSQAASVAG